MKSLNKVACRKIFMRRQFIKNTNLGKRVSTV